MSFEPAFYDNQMPERLLEEVRRFKDSGIVIGEAPDDDFMRLAAEGDPLLYVVTRIGQLIVCKHVLDAHHSVLADGGEVYAAGEVSLYLDRDYRMVLHLNEMSGHYRPSPMSLAVPARMFSDLGFGGVDQWIEP